MPAELTVNPRAPRLRQELPHIPHPHPYPILTPYPQFKAARKALPADLRSKEELFFYFVVDSAFKFPFDSTSEMTVDPDDISDLPNLIYAAPNAPLKYCHHYRICDPVARMISRL